MEILQRILELDKDLFLFLNGLHSDFWDPIMVMVTRQEIWIPFFASILFFIVKNYRSKTLLILITLAILIAVTDQFSGLIKDTFQRLRPVHDPAIAQLVHMVMGKGGSFGFVSAHAANSVALLVLISRIFKSRGYYFLMLTWVLVFCYSRIYVGVHYPLDLICGGLVGWLIGWGLYKLMMFVENHFFFGRSPKIEKTAISTKDTGTMVLVFSVLVSTFFIAVFILRHYNLL
ncbi:phosphatase PAP2 family protein [Draconibacterium halophilum]|uniref:Phosphatase PAP2 family protein n=1 Tax=Draconibacterium halophilum TaxID=2706887 RepID=A0A6C0R9I7_9BACT|nr:phosphatase PAP2 family protein [Draconibacterium halophilum]QIA07030.1 phosphatase PAP2 family protein [Draconibacterium halophilum]